MTGNADAHGSGNKVQQALLLWTSVAMATSVGTHLRVAVAMYLSCWALLVTESAAGGGVGGGGTGSFSTTAARVLPQPIIDPIKEDFISCQPRDVGVRCVIEPCLGLKIDPTGVAPPSPNSPCKGKAGYTCFSNYCSKATVFRGTPIPVSPCSAVYVNKTTGKVVKKCSPGIWRPTCVCPKIKKPVCGKNGKTYSNACTAKCAGVAIKWYDSCAVCRKCGKKGPKVCGANGKTYLNKCWLKCAGVKLAYAGACKPCVKQGGACDLTLKAGKKCCPGSICWTGPVAIVGKTKGTCYSRKGPLPIG